MSEFEIMQVNCNARQNPPNIPMNKIPAANNSTNTAADTILVRLLDQNPRGLPLQVPEVAMPTETVLVISVEVISDAYIDVSWYESQFHVYTPRGTSNATLTFSVITQKIINHI